jgi:hypothetical protein
LDLGEAQMKLLWQSGTGLISYVAEGKEYSYRVAFLPASEKWAVSKLRQQGGQAVNMFTCLTLQGALARAQAWENDG